MRIRILREYYCAKCPIVKRSPRSTGVKMLLSVTCVKNKRILDFGCGNWRNSSYLETLGAYTVKMDAIPDTKPDIAAYPTLLPFRDKVFDITLYTHVLMFLEDKMHWSLALKEATRVTREYLVLEIYNVKHEKAISYTVEELLSLPRSLTIRRRNMRKDMQNLVLELRS